MTLRDAAAAAITLMGLYCAGRVIALYAALMVTPFILSPQALSTSDPALAASVASGVGNLVLALIGLLGARRIAATFFAPTPLSVAIAGTRRDVLVVGIVLLGVWMAADGAAALLRSAGAFVYYAQQQIPAASLVRSWPQVVASAVTVATGVTLALSARALAARLDPATTTGTE
jgi:hypothetical protein